MQPIFNRLGSFVRWRPRRHRPRECRQGDPIIKKGRKPSSTSIGCRQEKIPNNLKVRFYFRFFSFETPLGWGEPIARSLDWTNKTIFGRKKKKLSPASCWASQGHTASAHAQLSHQLQFKLKLYRRKISLCFFLKLTFPSCLFASRGVPITTGGCLLLLLLCHPFLLLTRKLKSVENNRQSLCDNYIRHKRNEFK